MLTNLENELQQLLTPFRNSSGEVTRAQASDQALIRLEQKLITIFHRELSALDETQRKLFYRTAILCVHPDRFAQGNLTFNNQVIINQDTLKKLEGLFSANEQIQGCLFKFLTASYKKCQQPEAANEVTEAPLSEDNFFDKLEEIILKQNLCTVVTDSNNRHHWQLKQANDPIFVNVSPTQVFVGSANEWFFYQSASYLQELLTGTQDKKALLTRLENKLQGWYWKSLFPANMLNNARSKGTVNISTLSPLLTPMEAMIKYHLLIGYYEATREFARRSVMRGNIIIGNYYVNVRGCVNPQGSPFVYESYLITPYRTYQVELSIWQALFAAPDATKTPHRLNIDKFANASYSAGQYQTLCALFDEAASPKLLAKFGLTKNMLTTLNKQHGKPWLQSTTDWLYAHGQHASLCRPWGGKTEQGDIVPETYMNAYWERQWDLLWSSVARHPQFINLNRFNAWLKLLIISLPILWFISSVILIIFGFMEHAIFLNSTINTFLLVAPAGGLFILSALCGMHSFLESFLDNVAFLSSPLKVPPPMRFMPTWLHEYVCQILLPVARIAYKPLDPYYTHNTKLISQMLYPLRLMGGIILATLSSVSFIGVKSASFLFKNTAVGYFALANLWFDWPIYTKKIASVFQRTKAPAAKDAPTSSSRSNSATEKKEETPRTFLLQYSATPQPKVPSPAAAATPEAANQKTPQMQHH